MSNSLNETFDIIDLVPTTEDGGDTVEYKLIDYRTPAPKDNALEADYTSARDNLYTLLTLGEDALVQALNVAKQSEHPRAFEVVGNIMKQLSDINHQLLDLHKKKQSIAHDSKEEKDKPKNVTNNSIFVGSTAELATMISKMKKGE